jgi:16S rRNA processing protein RimM
MSQATALGARMCQGTFFFMYFIQEDYRMVDYLRVGVITSPHGLRGDVKVFPTTDDVNRFKKLKKAYIDTGKEKMPVTVEQVRFFKNMVILKFKEMNRIEDCEPFRNKDILITRDQAVKLNPDENFIADLIGLKVLTDEGEEFGTVKDILQTAANDVYVIEGPEGKEYLFPSIKECILNVDLEAGTVTVHIMDGLLDL